jgi:hypothetical protein
MWKNSGKQGQKQGKQNSNFILETNKLMANM